MTIKLSTLAAAILLVSSNFATAGGPVLMPKGKPSQVHKLIEGLHFQHFTQHFTCHRQYGENHVETLPANANLRQKICAYWWQHPYEAIGAYCRRHPRLCHPWRHEE